MYSVSLTTHPVNVWLGHHTFSTFYILAPFICIQLIYILSSSWGSSSANNPFLSFVVLQSRNTSPLLACSNLLHCLEPFANVQHSLRCASGTHRRSTRDEPRSMRMLSWRLLGVLSFRAHLLFCSIRTTHGAAHTRSPGWWASYVIYVQVCFLVAYNRFVDLNRSRA